MLKFFSTDVENSHARYGDLSKPIVRRAFGNVSALLHRFKPYEVRRMLQRNHVTHEDMPHRGSSRSKNGADIRLVGDAITFVLVALAALQATVAMAQPTSAAKKIRPETAPPFSTENEKCIVPASMYHGVNFHVLRAILKVESGLNPNAINRNNNGTVDVGMGQYNSMHFRELAKFGIAPGHLKDACISTYVSAWHLKKAIVAGGNTWEGIARYHSATPYFNQRYQILLKNELVRTGAMQGVILAVPPLNRMALSSPPSPSKSSPRHALEGSFSMIVTDSSSSD